jgi:hypothetical protein
MLPLEVWKCDISKYNNSERYNMQVRTGLLKVISYARYSHLHIYSVYTFPLCNSYANRKHIVWLVLPT